MKKVLINIILLFTFSISGMAQIEYGKTVEISKEVLLDKIKGGWAGQTIGCTYGGPTEFKYRGAIIHEKTPIIWFSVMPYSLLMQLSPQIIYPLSSFPIIL
jgi:hypothetical protein